VVVVWRVKPGALKASLEGRTHDVERGSDQLLLVADLCHVDQGNHLDPFIWPAHPVTDGDGCVGGVVLKERGLDLIDMTSAEVEAKTGPQRGEPTEFFLGWDPGAASRSAQDDGLDDSGDGEFTGQLGSRCLVCTDSRDDIHGNGAVAERTDLFVDGAVQGRVSVVKPNHTFPLLMSVHQQGDHLFKGERAGSNGFARLRSVANDVWRDQGISPDEDVCLLQPFDGSKGEKVGSTGAGAHKADGMVQRLDGSGWSL